MSVVPPAKEDEEQAQEGGRQQSVAGVRVPRWTRLRSPERGRMLSRAMGKMSRAVAAVPTTARANIEKITKNRKSPLRVRPSQCSMMKTRDTGLALVRPGSGKVIRDPDQGDHAQGSR